MFSGSSFSSSPLSSQEAQHGTFALKRSPGTYTVEGCTREGDPINFQILIAPDGSGAWIEDEMVMVLYDSSDRADDALAALEAEGYRVVQTLITTR